MEIMNPVTRELLRVPTEEADKKLSLISNLVDQQEELFSMQASNENVSQSYEEEESVICGQKTKVMKSILRKMLDYKTKSSA